MLSIKELHLRAAFFYSIRSFFTSHDFLEVDTPLRSPIIIPESNIEPITADGCFLQTSPELYMKRLLAQGCSNIFQICPCFRKGERGRYHLEEFIMLEWYRTDASYYDLMSDCQELLCGIVSELLRTSNLADIIEKEHHQLLENLTSTPPWERLRVEDAFLRYSPFTLAEAMQKDLFDETLVEYIEPELGQGAPLFLYEYPVELGSLARRNAKDERFAERFELYWLGVELGNAFSELTDAKEQRNRFERELQQIHETSGENRKMPENFLDALQNLDEAAGIALGLDRLLMLILGKKSIIEAVPFTPADF